MCFLNCIVCSCNAIYHDPNIRLCVQKRGLRPGNCPGWKTAITYVNVPCPDCPPHHPFPPPLQHFSLFVGEDPTDLFGVPSPEHRHSRSRADVPLYQRHVTMEHDVFPEPTHEPPPPPPIPPELIRDPFPNLVDPTPEILADFYAHENAELARLRAVIAPSVAGYSPPPFNPPRWRSVRSAAGDDWSRDTASVSSNGSGSWPSQNQIAVPGSPQSISPGNSVSTSPSSSDDSVQAQHGSPRPRSRQAGGYMPDRGGLFPYFAPFHHSHFGM
ncbi:uncharacterized protein BDZ99DRAFT_465916 [Mytilinidion resinicola]|uniref:Uncharacterized protein n=1 Tax=Mytilinidion resinicola TaxID=574789 RepID=A0A6A6YDW4_9PEZI|nr:uncharacterized protein BDZ99DRAFT_465916 [Mytilinidion resinicola]KAF2806275.1 hypothetical protein BDZ99DRAFT_465916 [Mytilinidion resinicola]